MTALSRRNLLAAALSLPAAGALADEAGAAEARLAATVLPAPAGLCEADAWAFLLDGATDALEAARATEEAARRQFRAITPAPPPEMIITATDRALGLTGDEWLGKLNGPRRGSGGRAIHVTDSLELRTVAARLADRPADAARIAARIPAVERFEADWRAADDAAGLSAAEEALFHARRRLRALVDQLLAEGPAFAGAARLAGCGMVAYAAADGEAAREAGARWGLRLAGMVAGGMSPA